MERPVVGYLLIGPAIVAVCALIGWLAWLRFNRWYYMQTRDPEAFKQAKPVAEAFRRPATAKVPGQVSAVIKARSNKTEAPSVTEHASPPQEVY
jgi:hypothetical protein